MINPIVILALKDLRLLLRDRLSIFWTLVFPLGIACLFGLMYSTEHEATAPPKIVVVDEDRSRLSEQLIEKMLGSSGAEFESDRLENARRRTHLGEIAGYFVIPAGLEIQAGLFGNETVRFEVGIDPARRALGARLEGGLLDALTNLLRERMNDPASLKELAQGMRIGLRFSGRELPVQQQDTIEQFMHELEKFGSKIDPQIYRLGIGTRIAEVDYYAFDHSSFKTPEPFELAFPYGMVWGLIGCTASFALSLVQERTAGTELRLRFAPLYYWQILAGKSLACFLTAMLTLLLLLAIGIVVFGVRVDNPLGLVPVVSSSALAFVGMTLCLGMLGRSELAVAGASWSTMLVMAMFGGAMVPLQFMPEWMSRISWFSPVRWTTLALEGVLWRSASFETMLQACLALIAFAGLGFILSWHFLRLRFQ